METEVVREPRCSITFTRSSTKDGQTGYTVFTEDGVTYEQVQSVMAAAKELRDFAEAVTEKK